MLKKITTAVLLLLVFSFGKAFAQYDMYLRMVGVKGDSVLLPLDGNKSYRVNIRFIPLPTKGDPSARSAPADFPAFMNLAAQVCRMYPGVLNVDVDKENKSVTVIFSASNRNEWIASLVNELTSKLKEGRNINIAGWDLDRQAPVP